MTSDGKMAGPLDPAGLAERFQTLATKSQAAVQGFLVNRPDVANIGMGDPAQIGQAFFELTTKLMADPRPVARAQLELWEQSVSLWARTLRHLLGGEPAPVSALDKRFKHSEWAENAIFSYIRDSYLLSARAILSAVRGVKGLDDETARKVEFYTKQFVDALAPSNFLATNPEVLSKTIETGGDNLLSGLTNLLNDLERGRGRCSVTMTDMNAFRLGEKYCDHAGQGRFPERDDSTHSVHTDDRASTSYPFADHSAVDQQIRPATRSPAQEFVHPLVRQAGAHGLRHLLDQSGRTPARQELRALHARGLRSRRWPQSRKQLASVQ